MTDRTTGRESPKFMLRLPDGMRERIADAAKANGRSMNAEIVSRLEQSFSWVSTYDPDTERSSEKRAAAFEEKVKLHMIEVQTQIDELQRGLERERKRD